MLARCDQLSSSTAALGLGLGLPDLTGGPRLPPVVRVEANRRAAAVAAAATGVAGASAAWEVEIEPVPGKPMQQQQHHHHHHSQEHRWQHDPPRLPGHGLLPRLVGLRTAVGASAQRLVEENCAAARRLEVRSSLGSSLGSSPGSTRGNAAAPQRRPGSLAAPPSIQGPPRRGLGDSALPGPQQVLLGDLRRLVRGFEESTAALFHASAEAGYRALSEAAPQLALPALSKAQPRHTALPGGGVLPGVTRHGAEVAASAATTAAAAAAAALRSAGLACRSGAARFTSHRLSLAAHATSAFALAPSVPAPGLTIESSPGVGSNDEPTAGAKLIGGSPPASLGPASKATPSTAPTPALATAQAALLLAAGAAAAAEVGALRRHFDGLSLRLYAAHAALDAALLALATPRTTHGRVHGGGGCGQCEGYHKDPGESDCDRLHEEAHGTGHGTAGAADAADAALAELALALALARAEPPPPAWDPGHLPVQVPVASGGGGGGGRSGSGSSKDGVAGAGVAGDDTGGSGGGDCGADGWSRARAALLLVAAAAHGHSLQPPPTPTPARRSRAGARGVDDGEGDVEALSAAALLRPGALGSLDSADSRGVWASPSVDHHDGKGGSESGLRAVKRSCDGVVEVLSTVGGMTKAEEEELAAITAAQLHDEGGGGGGGGGSFPSGGAGGGSQPGSFRRGYGVGLSAGLKRALVAELGDVLAAREPLPMRERGLPGGDPAPKAEATAEAMAEAEAGRLEAAAAAGADKGGMEEGGAWRRRPRRPGGSTSRPGDRSTELPIASGTGSTGSDDEGAPVSRMRLPVVPARERATAHGTGKGLGKGRPLLADFLRASLNAD